MRKSWTLLCLLVVVIFATKASARIWTVSQFGTADFVQITAAITAASTNDTILVGEGFYGDSLSPDNHYINNERLTIIGAGWDKVRVGGYFTIEGETASNTKLVGLQFEYYNSRSRILESADSVVIERCIFYGGSSGTNWETVGFYGGRAYVYDCVIIGAYNNGNVVRPAQTGGSLVKFEGCVFAHAISGHDDSFLACNSTAGPVTFLNCTFLNIWRLFNYTNPVHPVHVRNCVFYDWSTANNRTWGNFLAGSEFDYVAAGLLNPAFPGTFENTVTLSTNPFDIYDTGNNYVHGVTDLHLNTNANGGNLLRDTGDPNILDIDGTPSDYGVYGGPRPLVDNGVPAYPFVISLDVPGAVQPASDLNINSAGRVGPHY